MKNATLSWIQTRASRFFERVVESHLREQDIFPIMLKRRVEIPRDWDQPTLAAAAAKLHADSKATRGYGYTVHCGNRRVRKISYTNAPESITIDTLCDFLRLTGQQRDFDQAIGRSRPVLDSYPDLREWLIDRHGWKKLSQLTYPVESLFAVVEYLQRHPRPNIYLRELPLAESTKLVETCRSVLSDWLDLLLPASHIDYGVDAKRFAARYGFRSRRKHYFVRFLDAEFQKQNNIPYDELSIPLEYLDRLPVMPERILIVENRINRLTAPFMRNAIVLGGLGDHVKSLADRRIVKNAEVVYWGDIDVAGFRILSRLRNLLPNVRSVLMDIATIDAVRALGIIAPTNHTARAEKLNLTVAEQIAYDECYTKRIRIEQEKIPLSFVRTAIADIENTAN